MGINKIEEHIENVLKKYELIMPDAPAALGLYAPVKEAGDSLYFLSGCLPVQNGKPMYTGKLGKELTVEDGRQAARYCVLNLLANIRKEAGDLSAIRKIVKLTVFVACDNDFYKQPDVANGASQLLIELFGEEAGRAARSAVGVNALPGNYPVEIEAIVEVGKRVKFL